MNFLEQKEDGNMEIYEIEMKLPKAFFKLHEEITKILEVNNIVSQS